jgi:pyruvate/2-oxoglutarate dehydrogenase complex dihydrolipoamide acyltransferase (E2) component
MKVQIIFPKLGFSMEEGRLVSWLHPDGTPVTAGVPLYEVETDKAVESIEAPASGTLNILAPADSVYSVGTVIGELLPADRG